ncbi:LysE family translocator [Gracilibacillus salinarum]|uniref:LysE family translocator n=1 Tax=Gracilibacillus salinarum TaxID=2932255 RepID=A0ABY4GJU1_9BACI|nr:LysE family translocator [Gracilibacillus salinarum]UOQ84626.1 LysE family translocator [Gracilibacillus salinarum]
MSHYYMFIFVSLIIIMTPGPDFILITKNALTINRHAGRMTSYGVVTGHIIYATASILGFTAIIAKSIVLFEGIKYTGGIYLLYLGIKAILSSIKNKEKENTEIKLEAELQVAQKNTSYFQGLASTLLNPKAIMFYISFLPQFIDLQGNIILQSVILAGLFIITVLLWFTLYLYILTYISSWFKKPSVERIFDRVSGIALIYLGIKLALGKN